jgi:hypothetical protein
MRERMAAYAHEAWVAWVRYALRFGDLNADGSFTIHAETVAAWRAEMAQTYAELPEARKTGFRAEADIILGAQRIITDEAG